MANKQQHVMNAQHCVSACDNDDDDDDGNIASSSSNNDADDNDGQNNIIITSSNNMSKINKTISENNADPLTAVDPNTLSPSNNVVDADDTRISGTRLQTPSTEDHHEEQTTTNDSAISASHILAEDVPEEETESGKRDNRRMSAFCDDVQEQRRTPEEFTLERDDCRGMQEAADDNFSRADNNFRLSDDNFNHTDDNDHPPFLNTEDAAADFYLAYSDVAGGTEDDEDDIELDVLDFDISFDKLSLDLPDTVTRACIHRGKRALTKINVDSAVAHTRCKRTPAHINNSLMHIYIRHALAKTTSQLQ